VALQGPIPVEFGVVFPSGAYAAGAFEPVRNFDASTGEKFVQSSDKTSGMPLWVIEVIDGDPAARVRAVKVKVAAQVQPVVPAGTPGSPFVPVVHRADRDLLRQPSRAAGLLAESNRHPLPEPRPPWPSKASTLRIWISGSANWISASPTPGYAAQSFPRGRDAIARPGAGRMPRRSHAARSALGQSARPTPRRMARPSARRCSSR